jgi:hypothetical protein
VTSRTQSPTPRDSKPSHPLVRRHPQNPIPTKNNTTRACRSRRFVSRKNPSGQQSCMKNIGPTGACRRVAKSPLRNVLECICVLGDIAPHVHPSRRTTPPDPVSLSYPLSCASVACTQLHPLSLSTICPHSTSSPPDGEVHSTLMRVCKVLGGTRGPYSMLRRTWVQVGVPPQARPPRSSRCVAHDHIAAERSLPLFAQRARPHR